MEISWDKQAQQRGEEFKIDLIVWKFAKIKKTDTKSIRFKIDLIVWKFITR